MNGSLPRLVANHFVEGEEPIPLLNRLEAFFHFS